MKKEATSVALIFGGRGFEHEVSLRGAEYVYPLIDTSNYRKIPVYIKKDGTWVTPALRDIPCCPRALADEAVPTEECFPAFIEAKGGLQTASAFIPIVSAFPLLHGDFGEDGVVEGALENARIPNVGCDTQASAVTRDKCYVKLIAKHLGIPTAKWIYVMDEMTENALTKAETELGYPMFIKPARLGSSVGAGIAHCRTDLAKALHRALDTGSGRAMIEEYIDVEKELECGYFSAKSKELFTSIGQISYAERFYDYETKYLSNTARLSLRADIQEREAEKIYRASRLLIKFLGIRGLSRVDFFLSRDGNIYFNEINTMPGFTESSLYPRLVAECGIPPRELVNLLIEDAKGK